MPRTPEALATRVLVAELDRAGCFTRKLAGSAFQSGVPDLYALTPFGRHLWLEVKRGTRATSWPEVVDWLALFGRRDAAGQDEFIRGVCALDPDGARVVTVHDRDELWALHRPGERPGYALDVVGKSNVITWVLRGGAS